LSRNIDLILSIYRNKTINIFEVKVKTKLISWVLFLYEVQIKIMKFIFKIRIE